MNLTDQPPPIPNPAPDFPRAPRLSLLARLFNVFSIPRIVFEDVQVSRFSVGNWLIPILLAALVGTVTFLSVFSRPDAIESFKAEQKKNYSEMVASGKITQAEADQRLRVLDWTLQPIMLKATSIVVAFAFSVMRIFSWALVLCLLGKIFLKVRIPYFKALEIVGLASMITVLGGIVGMLLTVSFGHSAGSDLQTAMEQFQSRSQTPLALILANVFSIWFVALLALGLARLTAARFTQAFMMVMGSWLLLQILLGGAGLAVAGLTK